MPQLCEAYKSSEQVEAFYRQKLTVLFSKQRLVDSKVYSLRLVLIGLGVCTAFIFVSSTGHNPTPYTWLSVVSIFATLGSVFLYMKTRRLQRRILRLISLYERNVARVNGNEPQSGHTGEEFHSLDHLYDRELCSHNFYMASPTSTDPFAFDNILRPGINSASSVQGILKLLDIDEDTIGD